jgi:hypothetical protein
MLPRIFPLECRLFIPVSLLSRVEGDREKQVRRSLLYVRVAAGIECKVFPLVQCDK